MASKVSTLINKPPAGEPDADAKLRQFMSGLSPAQRASLEAQMTPAAEEDEGPISSLSELKAISKTPVSVYPDHPKRLIVYYLPVVAANPAVAMQLTKILTVASRIQEFANAMIAKGNAMQEAGEAAQEAGEAIPVTDMDELFDEDEYNKLMDEYGGRLGDWLTTVCNGWSLKEPFTKELLMDPDQCGLGIMGHIFQALQAHSNAKNVKGSTSITTS